MPISCGPGSILHTFSVVQVRAVTQQTLLFRVGNNGFPNQNSGDLSHNGLWMIHTDGTGLTRLTTDSANLSTQLNADSQYPWSNVSRDGNLYAVEQQTAQKSGNPGTAILLFGSLSGGTPPTFAQASDGTGLSIVGWTTMA
jgi:eukaryotic-like serine/threonine-protein kinase